jgi:hypothetical protein
MLAMVSLSCFSTRGLMCIPSMGQDGGPHAADSRQRSTAAPVSPGTGTSLNRLCMSSPMSAVFRSFPVQSAPCIPSCTSGPKGALSQVS